MQSSEYPSITPRIDETGVTFIWHGSDDIPQLSGDFNGWQGGIDLAETMPNVWTHTLTLPRDAYVEYSFSTSHDVEERFLDPLNPRLVYNGVEAVNNYFTMPDYQPNPLIARQPGVKRGKVSEHWLETDGFTGDTHRKLYLYHPPVDEPTPLVVVWDGADYLQRGRLNAIVDNLIAQQRIRPVALALIANGGKSRFVEYMQNEGQIGFLMQAILPFASQQLNLIDPGVERGVHGVLGSSMGGLMALYTGLRAADLFGHVVCQSGAFWFGDPRYDMLVVEYLKTHPVEPLKIWQDVGTLEDLLDGNRKVNAILKDKGYDVTYREFSGGHNQTMWADNTWRALEALYGV